MEFLLLNLTSLGNWFIPKVLQHVQKLYIGRKKSNQKRAGSLLSGWWNRETRPDLKVGMTPKGRAGSIPARGTTKIKGASASLLKPFLFLLDMYESIILMLCFGLIQTLIFFVLSW